jgi:hypothetical protein
MKSAAKIVSLASLALIAVLMAACSGVKPTSGGGGGGGGGTGPYTISAAVTGLTQGQTVVVADNTTDTLTFTTNTTTPFAVAIPANGAYNVTIITQPASDSCTVVSGSGKATANVTVQVNCTFVPVTATIGGTVTGLVANSTLVLQDNGGDALTLTGTGNPISFTFKTPVTGPTDAYDVEVNTQPLNPLQICTVSSNKGTATANVTNVAVSCVLAYTIGGTITGVVGTGLTLQNTGAELLKITGNGEFTFVNPVPINFAYTVTISTQPTNPAQTCVITPGTGSGTATANVTTVAITCPAITYSVGGNVVGLAGVTPNNGPETDGHFVIEDTLGNSLTVSVNGPFTFATPYALNDQYQVSILHSPSTQPQGCSLWDYKGVVTGNVTSIVVDCAHNDWTWIDGLNVAGTISTPKYGQFPTAPPPTIPNPYTNTPGARYGAAGWTDKYGNLFLFGGDGWELTGNASPDTLNAPMNDMWVCIMDPYSPDECEWQLVGGYDPTASGNSLLNTIGAEVIANAQTEAQPGVYVAVPALPYPTPTPGGRVGAATWTDGSGNLWLFGGKTPGAHFLNDLWEYNTSAFNGANLNPYLYTTALGQWNFIAGADVVDQQGTYSGAGAVPGARVNSVSLQDSAGNFWLFGGYGFDGSGNIGYLNDLWEYTAGKWVFVSGSALANQNGVYGTQGTASATNIPGGRHEAVGWIDASGNIWIFGGEGEDSVGTANGILNDLWMYNGSEWTFVTGSVTANQTGVYGLQPLVGPPSTTGAAGTIGLTGATPGTFPGSRWGANAWVDQDGNFWLFGGWGLDSTGTNGNGALNDLWVYTPNSNPTQAGTWTWVKGSNTGSDNGIYGPETRPYFTYEIWTPGGRSSATHWYVPQPNYNGLPQNGLLWMFGGEGYDSTSTTGNGYLNDLWRYLPYKD